MAGRAASWHRLVLALAAALLGGCNQLFALQPTALLPPDAPPPPPDPCANDRDCDGIDDSLDTCPDVPDPTNADADHDGVGDACDPCSWVYDPMRDDDGDAVASGTDKCPGTRDPSQTDSDGDGVGDACDPQPNVANSLVCFSDFTSVTNALQWNYPATSWWLDPANTVLSTSMDLSSGGTPPYLSTAASGLLPELSAFAIEASLTGNPGQGFEMGVGIMTLTLPDLGARCVLRNITGLEATVSLLAEDGSVLADHPLTGSLIYNVSLNAVRLIAHRRADGTDLECDVSTAYGITTVTGAAPALPGRLKISLIGTGGKTSFESLALYKLN